MLPAPVYAPLEGGARSQVMPGQIAYRTVDQTIVIGCELPANALDSELCMAGRANVFAHALTGLQDLSVLPERFRVKFEAMSRDDSA